MAVSDEIDLARDALLRAAVAYAASPTEGQTHWLQAAARAYAKLLSENALKKPS